jgi:hypothetical protein
VLADGVTIRTYNRVVSPDWDGIRADGQVDVADSLYFAPHFLAQNSNACSDFNGSGVVDDPDSVVMATAVNVDRNAELCTLVGIEELQPVLMVGRVHPNPSRGSVRLLYALPRAQFVSLEVIDISGRLVRVIERGEQSPGHHEAVWDGFSDGGTQAAAGIYFFRFRTSGVNRVQKFVMIR